MLGCCGVRTRRIRFKWSKSTADSRYAISCAEPEPEPDSVAEPDTATSNCC